MVSAVYRVCAPALVVQAPRKGNTVWERGRAHTQTHTWPRCVGHDVLVHRSGCDEGASPSLAVLLCEGRKHSAYTRGGGGGTNIPRCTIDVPSTSDVPSTIDVPSTSDGAGVTMAMMTAMSECTTLIKIETDLVQGSH